MKINWKIQLPALFISGLIYLFFIHDKMAAYINWKSLTKREVIQAAESYIAYHKIKEDACLYAVSCIDDRAHFRLIKDIESWNLEEAKQTVWQRKFDGTCTGRTANIGIYFTSENKEEWTNKTQHHSGIWSFSSNGFFRQMGRFSGASFSQQYSWENCMPEFAFITNPKK